jgi:hypothetical protein
MVVVDFGAAGVVCSKCSVANLTIDEGRTEPGFKTLIGWMTLYYSMFSRCQSQKAHFLGDGLNHELGINTGFLSKLLLDDTLRHAI